MYLVFRSAFLSFAFCWLSLVDFTSESNKKLVFMSLERPKFVDENPKYAHWINLTSQRRSRYDPVHYVQFCIHFFKRIDNNFKVHVFFYEFVSANNYQPSFAQFHFKFCEFLTFIKFNLYYARNTSTPLAPFDVKFVDNCYIEPGIYYVANVTVPLTSMPDNFPFEKGRFYVNHTYNKSREVVLSAVLDLEMKMIPTRHRKN